MRNIVKMIKTTLIASFCLVIAACSSGGSGSTEGLNISGRWAGTLQENRGLAYDVIFDFAQTDTVGVPGNSRSSNVTFSISVIRASDPSADLCTGATLSGGTLTINSEANPAILTGDGFNAVVIDNTISGQAVFEEFEPIPVVTANPITGELQETDFECAFGGPINLRRA